MTERKPPAAYFVNAPFDFAFVGGLSILTFAVLRLAGPQTHSAFAVELSALLQWGINWPHFSATVFRLFRTRENASQYPVTAYVIPLFVAAGAIGALALPDTVAPVFVKVFLIWSPYHFSGQSVGVSLIYARRAGVTLLGWPRLALSAFIFGTYAVSTLRAETSVASASYFGIEYPGLGVPLWMPRVAEWVMYLAGVVFISFVWRWSFENRRAFPLMVCLPAVTQYVWFVGGVSLQTFVVFVPLFHSLQYLPIAWAMQLGEKMGETSAPPSRSFVTRETVRWAAINVAGGACLFWVIPHLVAALGISLALASGVVIAAVQIHHFFVDGVIWKLRNRKVGSPLMANVSDYLAPRAASPAGTPA